MAIKTKELNEISGTIYYKEGVSKQISSKKLSSKGRDVRIWKLPERQKENQEWMQFPRGSQWGCAPIPASHLLFTVVENRTSPGAWASNLESNGEATLLPTFLIELLPAKHLGSQLHVPIGSVLGSGRVAYTIPISSNSSKWKSESSFP